MKLLATSLLLALCTFGTARAARLSRGRKGVLSLKGAIRARAVAAASGEGQGGWAAATWTIGSWNDGTDSAWNLCNGLGKKEASCSGEQLPGSPLPFEACRRACGPGYKAPHFTCTSESEEEAKLAWDLNASYPTIADGPEDLSKCVAGGPAAVDVGAKVALWNSIVGKALCVPNPDKGKVVGAPAMIKAIAATGHGLGHCGTLQLFKEPGTSNVVAQLQMDTRAWSFESTSEGWSHGAPTFCPQGSSCYAGSGCTSPLVAEAVHDWSCDGTPCSLPMGWALMPEGGSCDGTALLRLRSRAAEAHTAAGGSLPPIASLPQPAFTTGNAADAVSYVKDAAMAPANPVTDAGWVQASASCFGHYYWDPSPLQRGPIGCQYSIGTTWQPGQTCPAGGAEQGGTMTACSANPAGSGASTVAPNTLTKADLETLYTAAFQKNYWHGWDSECGACIEVQCDPSIPSWSNDASCTSSGEPIKLKIVDNMQQNKEIDGHLLRNVDINDNAFWRLIDPTSTSAKTRTCSGSIPIMWRPVKCDQ